MTRLEMIRERIKKVRKWLSTLEQIQDELFSWEFNVAHVFSEPIDELQDVLCVLEGEEAIYERKKNENGFSRSGS